MTSKLRKDILAHLPKTTIPCARCGGSGEYHGHSFHGVYTDVCYGCDGVGTVEVPDESKVTDDQRAQLYADDVRLVRERKNRRARRARKGTALRTLSTSLRRLWADRSASFIQGLEQEQRKQSRHIGAVKQRVKKAALLYARTIRMTGDMNRTFYIHCFTDSEQNALVWKTSSGYPGCYAYDDDLQDDRWQSPDEGDTVSVSFTIKAHTEYRGEKQTEISRLTMHGFANGKEVF